MRPAPSINDFEYWAPRCSCSHLNPPGWRPIAKSGPTTATRQRPARQLPPGSPCAHAQSHSSWRESAPRSPTSSRYGNTFSSYLSLFLNVHLKRGTVTDWRQLFEYSNRLVEEGEDPDNCCSPLKKLDCIPCGRVHAHARPQPRSAWPEIVLELFGTKAEGC